MKILAIDRSTDTQSAAFADGAQVVAKVFTGMDSRSGDWPVRVRDFLAAQGATVADLDEIVVGQGPGSFAGIRAALAFAQGIAVGAKAVVKGLPSAAAFASDGVKTAVVGDARRDRFWVIGYDGVKTAQDFRLVKKEELAAAVPEGYAVVTPDGARIDALLASIFADRYKGALTPRAARLAEIAVAHPELPVPEPLPIYLQPAVKS